MSMPMLMPTCQCRGIQNPVAVPIGPKNVTNTLCFTGAFSREN